MNVIERCLWLAVAVVMGSLGGTAYQKYAPAPVKHERKGEIRKVAEQQTTKINCVSQEVGQAVLDAYKQSQEEGDMTLVLMILVGACEIDAEKEVISI